jgi:hypothetical protein
MDRKDPGAAFDRDFGYLMPFLDKVRAAGEALPLGPREEMAALLQGEKERWTRIRELLSGGTRADTARGSAPAPAQAHAGVSPAGRLGFTIGTLRRRD